MKNIILVLPVFLLLSCGKAPKNEAITSAQIVAAHVQNEIPANAKLSDYKVVKVKILDSKTILKAIANPQQIIVEGEFGKIENFAKKIIAGAPFCLFDSIDQASITDNKEFIGITTREFTHTNGKRRLSIGTATMAKEIMTLGCSKMNNKEFTVKEVEDGFKGIVKITFEKK